MTVYVQRRILEFLPNHLLRCRICDVRRPPHMRQGDPGLVWAQVMAAPDPWTRSMLRRFLSMSKERKVGRMNGCWQIWTILVVGVLAWVFVGIVWIYDLIEARRSAARVAAFYARRRAAAVRAHVYDWGRRGALVGLAAATTPLVAIESAAVGVTGRLQLGRSGAGLVD